MGTGLQLHREVLDGCLVIHVGGELDLANSGVFQHYLVAQLDGERTDVVVDLTDVGFLDSTALSALIVAYQKAQRIGAGLRLAGATGLARKVLDIAQLNLVLDVHDDVSEAVGAALVHRRGERR